MGIGLSAQKEAPSAGNCVGEPLASTVIVIDQSEAISDQARDEIVARVMHHLREKVRGNERVSVFTVSDLSRKSLRPLVSQCWPADKPYQFARGASAMRGHFEEGFSKPVLEALATLPAGTGVLPIAQALTDLSLSQYLRAPRNSLLVFSSMLENTGRFSLHRCAAPGDVVLRFRASRSGAQERPAFKNTLVNLHLIPKLDQPQAITRCRDALWTWFFGNNDGPDAGVTLDYLPGGD